MRPERFGMGAPVRRKEDFALLTGQGRYLADITREGMAHAAMVRSAVAHAEFRIRNAEDVRAMDGVIDVLTAADVDHLGDLPTIGTAPTVDGTPHPIPSHPVLPVDTVRYVGDPIAMVVAETQVAARDAAEALDIAYDERPHIVDLKASADGDGPVLWPDIGSNIAFTSEFGEKPPVDNAFAKADRVVSLELVNNRVVTNYMEPRGCLGEYDPETERFTLTVSSQGVHLIQPVLARHIFGVDKSKIRVVTPDVGGGFGTKYFTYREYVLSMEAARRTGRPVRWIADRTETFLGDYQGRDNVSRAELAVDAKGKFLGIRVDTIANMGAYLSQLGPFIPVVGAPMIAGVYRTPACHIRVRGVYTNTVPVDAYRGAGRPEAAYLIERLVDKAARELGIKPETLRKRNFITPSMMPFTTPTGRTYDTGDFSTTLNTALEGIDQKGFNARARASRKAGRLRGLGIATYIEACAGGSGEDATVTLAEDGSATVLIGTQSQGQGHQTAYAQIVAETLGLPIEKIHVIQGDTDLIARGGGTGGSRSIPVGAPAIDLAGKVLAERLRKRAADHLEAAAADLEFDNGDVVIAGTDRRVPVATLVGAMSADERSAMERWTPDAATYPNGTHAVEVEVDPSTGTIAVMDYVVIDDFGVTLNPLMLEGQVQGGVIQGIGQAVLERTVYDPESGQLLTATFMDYCMPRADDSPFVRFETRNIPCKTNALGLKGAGEAGAIGACPAMVNAVVDALHRAYGITHVDMPMTPQSIWSAIEAARSAAVA
ncbi:MAG: xanthine dehydrogenase family protein molybdopterin-binding subunit [Pseudomonadota bacterium]